MFSLFKKNDFKAINVNDLGNLSEKINLIDIRETHEYKSGHVPGAKNIPMNEILTHPEKYLSKDKEYHIICQSGGRSTNACKNLSAQGYQVINVTGGTGSFAGTRAR